MRQNKIDIFSYERQLESELAWNQIIRSEASRSELIDPKAIDQQISLIRANKGKLEYLVAEIYIPFDAAETPTGVKNLAERIKRQIRQGARFDNLARSFSQSASAARGGSLGWVRQDQLDPALADVVRHLKRGELSAPVKGADGYYLLQLQNKRIARRSSRRRRGREPATNLFAAWARRKKLGCSKQAQTRTLRSGKGAKL